MREKSPDADAILRANLQALMDYSGLKSKRAWALSKSLLPKNIQRIMKAGQSPSLTTLQEIADACELTAWQLLTPNLDPSNPPVVTMTETERSMYRNWRKQAQELPTLGS